MSTPPPVTPRRIEIAKRYGLHSVDALAAVCRLVDVPFYVGCALLEQESYGRNVYGHDVGGALSGFPYAPNRENYRVFRWLVFERDAISNGVGPCQITARAHLQRMEDNGLQPWVVVDNITYGLTLLRDHMRATGSWQKAGVRYNGASSYGVQLQRKIDAWHDRLGI